jgi:hypothetical protein
MLVVALKWLVMCSGCGVSYRENFGMMDQLADDDDDGWAMCRVSQWRFIRYHIISMRRIILVDRHYHVPQELSDASLLIIKLILFFLSSFPIRLQP